jgi:hypothetical protein
MTGRNPAQRRYDSSRLQFREFAIEVLFSSLFPRNGAA